MVLDGFFGGGGRVESGREKRGGEGGRGGVGMETEKTGRYSGGLFA